jgi:hypothetical protein
MEWRFLYSVWMCHRHLSSFYEEKCLSILQMSNIKQRFLTTHIVFLESGHSRLNVLVKCLLLRRTKTQIDKAGKPLVRKNKHG